MDVKFNVRDSIKKPSQLTIDTGLKVLVYGAAGAGKTTLCATTGAPEHTLVISAEAGLLSIRESAVDAVSVSKISDLRELLAFLKDTSNHKYKWICLDSISEIAEQILASEKEGAKDPRQAYGEMADVMLNVIKAFRDLPMNVYMSCKGQMTEDEGRQVWGPMLPGKALATNIPYLFDEVFCLVARTNKEGGVTRKLITGSDGKYLAKDRSGKLAQVEDPDLATLYKKIHGPRVASA